MGVLNETVNTLRDESFAKMEAIQKIKKSQLNDYIANLKSQLRIVKDDPYVKTALTEFDRAFEAGGDSVNSAAWRNLEKKYDERMEDIMVDFGWYDFFLIHVDGDIVYTVAMESDLGMIIPDSSLADSPLGDAFFKAQKITGEEVAVGDFAPYEPSGGVPGAFMMAPMRNNSGKLLGYAALQIPLDKINHIMLLREGMGETGESYLVGQDLLMRSDSYLDPVNHTVDASFANPELGKADTEAVRLALSGIEGKDVMIDYNGNPVLSCWDIIDVGSGVQWAMLTEIDVAEAFSPKDEEGTYFFEKYVNAYGYYDLFLINPDGYVFYSAAQESDYQTNMVNGKYYSSGLGKLVREVLEVKEFSFADFEPYAPRNDEPAAFIAQPVLHQGDVEIIVALQLPLDGINNIMQERTGMGKTGETYLVGEDLLMRSDSFLDPENHTVIASFANPNLGSVDTEAAREALAGNDDEKIIIDYNGNPVLSAYMPIEVFGHTWALIAEIDQAEVNAPVRSMVMIILVIGVAMAVIVALIALFIGVSISNPLVKGVAFTKLVADGDLTQELNITQKDEVGMLAEALNRMVGNLRNMTLQILDGSSEIASSSEEMSASAQQLSEGAQSQASTLEETSAAVEELSASVEQVSGHAQSQSSAVEQSVSNMDQVQKSIDEVSTTLDNVSGIAKESVEKSKSGAETVGKAVDAINLISESSDKIAGIINVISDIADQTNLLALNASIEAARAGEHGRGFAVVADEVSKLADRSASSTTEIEALIKESTKNVKDGVELAQESRTSMEEITEGAQKSADMITNLAAALEQQVKAVKELSGAVDNINEMSQSISAATEEQTTNSKQVSKAIEDVNEITQQAASAAEEMAASTEELSGMAQQLQSLVSQFKVEGGDKDVKALPGAKSGKRAVPKVDKREKNTTPAALPVEYTAQTGGEKNVEKQNCWEFKKCGREKGGAKVIELGECPASSETMTDGVNSGDNAGRTCWAVAGTLCGGKVQGSFAHKMYNCKACEFYKIVTKEEGRDFDSGNDYLRKAG